MIASTFKVILRNYFRTEYNVITSFQIKAPNVLARSDIGFPFLVPLSKPILKGGEKHHSWWYGMVLKSRYIKELFKPASGMVIELYRNNLFDPMNIGNFAPIFAYSELSINLKEKELLLLHPKGLLLSNLSFRDIDIDQPTLPKLRLAVKMILKKGGICTLDEKGMKDLTVMDEAELIRLRMEDDDLQNEWNSNTKPKGQTEIGPRVAGVGSNATIEAAKEKPQSALEQALLKMSYDYLEAKRRNDFLEEVNKNLIIECESLKSANEISIWPNSKGGKRGKSGDGDPDIAKQFALLQERQKDYNRLNESLMIKVRKYEQVLLSKGKESQVQEQKLREQEREHKKLQDVCKEQEKIIAKLEDLFDKTKLKFNVDNRWKNDFDDMVMMARQRHRYDPACHLGGIRPPCGNNYGMLPAMGPQAINHNPQMQIGVSGFRSENRELEKQMQDLEDIFQTRPRLKEN